MCNNAASPLVSLLLSLQIFIAEPDGHGDYSITQEPLAYSSPGRTLGVKFDAEGNLYMANSPLGLLQLVAPGEAALYASSTTAIPWQCCTLLASSAVLVCLRCSGQKAPTCSTLAVPACRAVPGPVLHAVCVSPLCLTRHVPVCPASAGDAQEQKLILATGRVSDESPLLAGYPVEFANSLDIASDGTVYFSCSTDVLAYK
jgi:hypothetical protein